MHLEDGYTPQDIIARTDGQSAQSSMGPLRFSLYVMAVCLCGAGEEELRPKEIFRARYRQPVKERIVASESERSRHDGTHRISDFVKGGCFS